MVEVLHFKPRRYRVKMADFEAKHPRWPSREGKFLIGPILYSQSRRPMGAEEP